MIIHAQCEITFVMIAQAESIQAPKSKMSRQIRKGPLARPAGFRETGNEMHILQSISKCGHW